MALPCPDENLLPHQSIWYNLHYPKALQKALRITGVQANLNTHIPAWFYKAFEPAQAPLKSIDAWAFAQCLR
jgi:hypothetical protein